MATRTKKFIAPTLRQALEAMRRELGEDALLLATQSGIDSSGQPFAEVVGMATNTSAFPSQTVIHAAGAPSFHSRTPALDKGEPVPLRYFIEGTSRANNDIEKLEQEIHHLSAKLTELTYAVAYRYSNVLPHPYRQLYSMLRDAGFSETHAGHLISSVIEEGKAVTFDGCLDRLRVILSQLLRVRSPFSGAIPPIIAFAGPSGSGKTTTLMKTAIRLQQSYPRSSLQILNADNERMGASDQLRSFASLLKVGFSVIHNTIELQQACTAERHFTLVDLPAPSERTLPLIESVVSCVQDNGGVVFLTIPATSDQNTAQAILEQYHRYSAIRLVLTKLDEAQRLGHILSLLWDRDIPISLLTAGTRLNNDLVEPSIDYLMKSLFGASGNRSLAT
ncbi:MAG: hypothetical protein RMK00_01110 [Bacteroidota bacterium]|nr:hypothetical protein [Candidatus Kapabacteria bacterium]MDW8074360.1 hypothetical protein [Bacteroidota bacterium]